MGVDLLNAPPIFMKIGLEIHNRLLFSKYGCAFDFRCRPSCLFDKLRRRRYSFGGGLSCGGGEVQLEGGGSLSRLHRLPGS